MADSRLTLFEIITRERENPTDCPVVSAAREPHGNGTNLERREPICDESVPLLVRREVCQARRRDNADDVARSHRYHTRYTELLELIPPVEL